MMSKRTFFTAAIMLISIPLFWKGLIAVRNYPNFIVPPPEMVWDAITAESSIFWFHTKSTIQIALEGYLYANLLALIIAVLFVYIPLTEHILMPWAMIITMIPFPVIAGIFAVTFRDPHTPKLIIIVLITFYPLLVNLTSGLKSVEPEILNRMKVINANRWQIFRYARWPAALPFYLAGHKISFASSIIGAIVAEWFFSREGLGFLIIRSQMQYRTDKLYAVAIIGLTFELIALTSVYLAENKVLAWRRK